MYSVDIAFYQQFMLHYNTQIVNFDLITANFSDFLG